MKAGIVAAVAIGTMFVSVTAHAGSRTPLRVALVQDGTSEWADRGRAAFADELETFFGSSRAVSFPDANAAAGDWTRAGVAAALDRQIARDDVDVVVALGPLGSSVILHRTDRPKPLVAALVIDGNLQGAPVKDETSGVHNMTFVDGAFPAQQILASFHEMIPFRRLAVLLRPELLDIMPELRTRGVTSAESLGVTLTFATVSTSAAATLLALPHDIDAVGLGTLDEYDAARLDSLLDGLRARRLPAFAFAGRREVERGALAAYGPKDDLVRRARRVAGDLQRIADGEDPASLPVVLESIAQLTLNMETARAIGYSPTWVTLAEAELIQGETPATGPIWSLSKVAHEALRANLALRAADREVASGRSDVAIAVGQLLPQVQAQVAGTMVREETAAASFGQQPERETSGRIGLSLPVISDSRWANASVEARRQEARVADRRGTELDAVYDATRSYLDVLRSRAIAALERENLRDTRTNHDLAELRERSGAVSRADVFRWTAELAKDRRAVLNADARERIAAVAFNRELDRDLEESFQAEDATTDDPALVTGDSRVFDYFATPETFRVFRDFMVIEGLARSPELEQIDASIAATRRVRTAARRSLWLPTVTLDASTSDVFSRAGAGSTSPAFGPFDFPHAPDATWSLRLQGSLPLFDGFIRTSQLRQARIDLERLEIQRRALTQSVSARIRSALEKAEASWFGIEQARLAATASRSNLELVSDAYTRGATSIVTLLDAKQAALAGDEAAANAVYDFLIDLMAVERAVGRFGFFRTAEEQDALLRRMDAFYRQAGVSPDHH